MTCWLQLVWMNSSLAGSHKSSNVSFGMSFKLRFIHRPTNIWGFPIVPLGKLCPKILIINCIHLINIFEIILNPFLPSLFSFLFYSIILLWISMKHFTLIDWLFLLLLLFYRHTFTRTCLKANTRVQMHNYM